MFKKIKSKNSLGYLFSLHWLIGFLLFTMLPILYSIYISFRKVNITANGIESTFIGFENFKYALTLDLQFLKDYYSTLKSVVLLTPLIIIISLILAILLNKKVKFRSIYRAIYFLPVIILSGSTVETLFNGGAFQLTFLENGDFIYFLENINIGYLKVILFFILKNLFVILWFSGVQILIYLAGLQRNPVDIYEAAQIDGATNWQMFWKITLPSINSITLINIIYTIVLISSFSAFPISKSIDSVIFSNEAYAGFGYASTISWIYFLSVLVVLSLYLYLFKSKK